MGERLGRIDALVRQGITPISPDEGVSILRRLIAHPPPQVSVVVTGRFGEVLAVKGKTLELPFLRFLENPKVYYPGVELVVDTDLSPDTDRYLDDHVFQGQRLLPAVMGLEAMAQASMTLIGAIKPPVFENVKFIRPVVVPDGKPVTVRVAALVQNPGRVQMVLRSDNTGFQADHIQATCSFEHQDARLGGTQTLLREPVIEATDLAINPEGDVYGKILFHSGRFRRLRGYKRLRATECIAEISPDVSTNWFARYLPDKFVLGDPAARDAAIHAIQSCIPHAMVLPIGVDKLEFAWTETSTPRFVYAKERSRDNSTFIYDVEVTDAEGQVGERWEGLQLRMVAGTTFEGEWVEPLLGPYIERSVSDLVPGSKITVEINRWANGDRRSRSDRAIQQILGEDVLVLRRPDGKPELGGNHHAAVSVAHTGDLTLAVAGPGPVGCDVEPVADRPDSLWQELLGRGGFQLAQVIVQEGGESLDRSATRVWATMECLKKAGVMSNGPLVLASLSKDGWVLLGAGQLVTATVVVTVRGAQNPLVLAVLVGSGHANL
jgi:enediyne polyketide synthase